MADADVADTILDDDILWRRVRPSEVIEDRKSGTKRPKSMAFQNHPDRNAMSVQVARWIDFKPDVALAGHDGYLLVAFSAGLARECQQTLEPAPDEGLGHVHVVGKKTGSVKSRLSKECTWVVPPAED